MSVQQGVPQGEVGGLVLSVRLFTASQRKQAAVTAR